MIERHHISLPVPLGAAFESQSGLFTSNPRIYGVLAGPPRGRIGAIVMHPTSNLMGHYLLEPLAQRGVGLLALNSRFVGNDSVLLMERVIQDLGAGVKYMREHFDKVILLGNSGGASLTAFYQAQAENLTITETPAGDPIRLTPEELPPADGIALMAAHLGRSELMLHQLDASVTDERDGLSCDPALDIYDPRHKPPFSADFVQRIRDGQHARSQRITAWALDRLKYLRGLPQPIQDEAFVVYRTYADPRFLDLTLDPNDRKPGGNRGSNPREVNYSVNNLARYTALTSWLSQWSLLSRARGPANLALTTVPVLNLEYTGDGSIFPADVKKWSDACKGRESFHKIEGATHYLKGQDALIAHVADLTAAWADITTARKP
ncbi:hypothetical protein [Xenophilus azovorans]|uniref:hypothetical protein n=1 Tax=Xenophilus azovorans TaxID=151755 RepID=UPI00057002F6|nr:hypothetical protein [Xenophilus azovorans]